MRRPISLYGLTFSLPLLIWQILFFVFPLVFLVAQGIYIAPHLKGDEPTT